MPLGQHSYRQAGVPLPGGGSINRHVARRPYTAILLFAVVVLPFATASIDAGQPIDSEFADDEGSSAEDRGSDAWLRLLVTYYDSEGNFGLMTNFGLSFTGRYLEYQFAGEDIVHIGGSRSLNEGTSRAIGTPYAFRTFTEEYGSIMGFSRVIASGGNYARFTVPVPASSLGLTNGPNKQPFLFPPESTGHGTALASLYDVFVADSKHVPSLAIPAYLLPDVQNRAPTILSEYLVGNSSHESVGEDTVTFASGVLTFDATWTVGWGFTEESGFPSSRRIPGHLPLAQLRQL